MPEWLPGLARRRVPLILQQESAACGVACIAMVAGFFGKSADPGSVRRRAPGSAHGCNLQDLLDMAEEQQLHARPLRLALSDLAKLRLPAVLHWRMNHFVVLTKMQRNRARIHDPASGRRTVGRGELGESFTGIALEFTPRPGFVAGKRTDKLSLADLVAPIRRLYRYLGLMLCLLCISQLLALIPAVATQLLVDEVVLGQDRRWLYRALGGLLLVMLVTTLLEGMRGWIGLYTGTRLATDSSLNMLAHVLSLPQQFIANRHLGDLMSKLESLTPVRQMLTDVGINAVVQFAVLVSTLLIMFLYSPALTAVSLAGFAASILLLVVLIPRSRRLNAESLVQRAAQDSSLLETLRGYDTVQSLGLGKLRLLHWQNHFLSATGTDVALGKLAILRNAVTSLIATAEQLLFLAVGISGVLDRDITVGVLFAFMALRGRFAGAAMVMSDLVQRIVQLDVHVARLADLALAAPQPGNPRGALRRRLSGRLAADNVAFGYPGSAPTLRGVSLRIEAGAHTVITGPSGCGKTTLLRLLCGQLRPQSGRVLVDDIELRLWHQQVVRRQTGVVLQGDGLFRGTISENISAFSPQPDLARVRAAAIAAEIWNEIERLPMQSETLIGDTGVSLSGGQVQRLTLARALYRRPRILFLDEATSQLDVRTERRVLHNIARLKMTVVSVAHRPDAIRLASQVIALDVS